MEHFSTHFNLLLLPWTSAWSTAPGMLEVLALVWAVMFSTCSLTVQMIAPTLDLWNTRPDAMRSDDDHHVVLPDSPRENEQLSWFGRLTMRIFYALSAAPGCTLLMGRLNDRCGGAEFVADLCPGPEDDNGARAYELMQHLAAMTVGFALADTLVHCCIPPLFGHSSAPAASAATVFRHVMLMVAVYPLGSKVALSSPSLGTSAANLWLWLAACAGMGLWYTLARDIRDLYGLLAPRSVSSQALLSADDNQNTAAANDSHNSNINSDVDSYTAPLWPRLGLLVLVLQVTVTCFWFPRLIAALWTAQQSDIVPLQPYYYTFLSGLAFVSVSSVSAFVKMALLTPDGVSRFLTRHPKWPLSSSRPKTE